MDDLGRPPFDEMRAALRDAGFTESDAQYHGAAYGSWWVALHTQPPLAVVWDGQDGQMLIRRLHSDGSWAGAVWSSKALSWESRASTDTVLRALREVVPSPRRANA